MFSCNFGAGRLGLVGQQYESLLQVLHAALNVNKTCPGTDRLGHCEINGQVGFFFTFISMPSRRTQSPAKPIFLLFIHAVKSRTAVTSKYAILIPLSVCCQSQMLLSF